LFKQCEGQKKSGHKAPIGLNDAGYSIALACGLALNLGDDNKPANVSGEFPSHFEGFKTVNFIACFYDVFGCHGNAFQSV
jgi:hypothetical protein